MSNAYTLKISPEEAKEMPMVDLAFIILKAANTPYYYRDLMQEIAKIKGIKDDKVMDVIAQLYTEINIDGRFACVGTNLWGLKRWYPLEKAEDPVGNTQRPRIINDEEDDDDEDLFEEEKDEDFDANDKDSDNGFDSTDEDADDVDVDADEDVDADDDDEVDEELDLDDELSDGDDDSEEDDNDDENDDEDEGEVESSELEEEVEEKKAKKGKKNK